MGCGLGYKTLAYFAESGKQVVPCGSGKLALNFRKKMRLLGIRVPFIVSHFDDAENGIRHHSCLRTIENIGDYCLVFCEEQEHFYQTYEPLRETLLKIEIEKNTKLRFFNFSLFKTLESINRRQYYDIHTHRTYLRNGVPFVRYGDFSDGVDIHVLDSSVGADMTRYTPHCWPEFLQETLVKNGIPANVYNWSMSNYNMGNFIVKVVREIRLFHPDLVLLTTNIGMLDSLRSRSGASNLLKTRVDTLLPQWQARAIDSAYPHPTNTGIEVEETRGLIYRAQLRVVRSLARTLGFTCLNILFPQAELLPFVLGEQIPGMRRHYLERMHKLRDHLDDLPIEIRDFSHLFDGFSRVSDLYLEWRHLTTGAARLFAEEVSKDVIEVFNERNKEQRCNRFSISIRR